MQMIYQMPDTALNPVRRSAKSSDAAEFYFGFNRKQQEQRILELMEQIELSGGLLSTAIPPSCPAAKNSASASPAPWPPSPT
jgi:ABC-type dipeptide/oligopeptide/nickel transport system ATPase subunit